MINADMKLYNYFTIGAVNSYGETILPKAGDTPVGTIKMSIYTSSIGTQDNINYKDCNYIGLTKAKVNDAYVIEYEKELLKVLYVIKHRNYNQVFLKSYGYSNN